MTMLLMLAGCADLDFFVHNPVHCSAVSEDTCDQAEFDAVCVPCDEEYDWQRDYAWLPGTLDEGDAVRPVDPTRVERRTVPTWDDGGALDVYVIEPHGDDPALARTTFVYNHGNYAGVEHYQPRIRMLHEWGVKVIAWDYRGYGKSEPEGIPSHSAFLGDAIQVWDQVVLPEAPDADRIVAYGFSLGTIPTVEQGVHREPCALMLEAVFPGIGPLAEGNTGLSLPGSFLTSGRYENAEKIADYPGPVFVLGGDSDHIVRVADMEEVYEAAPGPKELWVAEGVDHGIQSGGLPEHGMRAYLDRLRGFLEDKAPGCLGD